MGRSIDEQTSQTCTLVQPAALCSFGCARRGVCTGNYPEMFAAGKCCAKSSTGKYPLLARPQELGAEDALMHSSRTEHLMHLFPVRGGRIKSVRAEESGGSAAECPRWTAARHSASSLSPAAFLFCNSSILFLSNLYRQSLSKHFRVVYNIEQEHFVSCCLHS